VTSSEIPLWLFGLLKIKKTHLCMDGVLHVMEGIISKVNVISLFHKKILKMNPDWNSEDIQNSCRPLTEIKHFHR
jgi:hypothetical protein